MMDERAFSEQTKLAQELACRRREKNGTSILVYYITIDVKKRERENNMNVMF